MIAPWTAWRMASRMAAKMVPPPPVIAPPPVLPVDRAFMYEANGRKIDVSMYGGSLNTGCHGDHHEPRPWVGDPPFPKWFSCYCGKKTWMLKACPTCGHERAVDGRSPEGATHP